ncbi:GCN5-related N-acetyltransferase (GNAT) domain-containingprotein [Purpureocillium lilacinum]|uniref:GCN5-related N-acetyltransferase (GNAT) domain-containingprotein n=1 Tax=Purpureocillium lilacinum TaxID=33203 RepID=A0A179HI74_PURLI|nr:GCN5-related N-acetyltransferase (GNAT) domain-containingprotein [Purpureocillium lilacinum]OAQ89734.1 GCN5-related N-acetyltransferase (GNAT) domain-containingprotein [Purpureocillium lilacinum]
MSDEKDPGRLEPPGPPPEQLGDRNDDLILRRWRTTDTDGLYAAASSSLAELARWMPWAAKGYSKADADGFLARSAGRAWDVGEDYDFAIIAEGRIVGSCGLMRRIGPGGLEIGYWIASDATGCGLATRAAAMLARAAFAMGADRVQIRHDEANERSAGVPRRLGFRCLGEAPPIDATTELPTPGTRSPKDLVWQLDGADAGVLDQRQRGIAV